MKKRNRILKKKLYLNNGNRDNEYDLIALISEISLVYCR